MTPTRTTKRASKPRCPAPHPPQQPMRGAGATGVVGALVGATGRGQRAQSLEWPYAATCLRRAGSLPPPCLRQEG